MAKSVLRVNYGLWLLRVAGWDGLLPLGVAAAPSIIQMLLPNQLGVAVTGFASVTLPAAAFLLCFRHGRNRIASNGCSSDVRRVQYYALYVGILPLALIDFVLIFCHIMPKGIIGLLEAPADWTTFALYVTTYITAMVVAMYPGAGAQSECADEDRLLDEEPV